MSFKKNFIVPQKCPNCPGCPQDEMSHGYICLAGQHPIDPDFLMRQMIEDRQRYEAARADASYGLYQTKPDSFLSPQMHDELHDLCMHDAMFEYVWRAFTSNVRSGLDDTIVRGVILMYKRMAAILAQERARLGDENRKSILSLTRAAQEVLRVWPEAQAKGDLVYLTQVIEELDAAVYDTIEVHDEE